jgi:glucose-1-phosphate adenylyltransferase
MRDTGVTVTSDLLREMLVVILGGGRGTRLDPLTRQRAKPAVPIAGKYRLIDLPISNAIHSGMERIFLITQFNSVSLHRHISYTYKFDIFSRGFVQILAAQQTPASESWFQGTADAVRRNLEILERRGNLVLILSGDHLYRMDYRAMLEDHLANDADITIAVMPCPEGEIANFGAVRVDETGRIVEFREKPKDAAARSGMEAAPQLLESKGISAHKPFLASMGIYLFKKDVLTRCLANDLVDFGHDVIPDALSSAKVQAHFFDGYWRDIGTIRSFYDAHMDMVNRNADFDFYDPEWPFFTRPRYLPGSRFSGCSFHDAILAGGATMRDCTVERSVVGLRTCAYEATIRNSLIMGAEDFPPSGPEGAPPVGVGKGTVIENAIIDLNARIGQNVQIVNESRLREAENDNWMIRDGIVVVPKNAIIPDGTVI